MSKRIVVAEGTQLFCKGNTIVDVNLNVIHDFSNGSVSVELEQIDQASYIKQVYQYVKDNGVGEDILQFFREQVKHIVDLAESAEPVETNAKTFAKTILQKAIDKIKEEPVLAGPIPDYAIEAIKQHGIERSIRVAGMVERDFNLEVLEELISELEK